MRVKLKEMPEKLIVKKITLMLAHLNYLVFLSSFTN
jgi:hypothetical protein